MNTNARVETKLYERIDDDGVSVVRGLQYDGSKEHVEFLRKYFGVPEGIVDKLDEGYWVISYGRGHFNVVLDELFRSGYRPLPAKSKNNRPVVFTPVKHPFVIQVETQVDVVRYGKIVSERAWINHSRYESMTSAKVEASALSNGMCEEVRVIYSQE